MLLQATLTLDCAWCQGQAGTQLSSLISLCPPWLTAFPCPEENAMLWGQQGTLRALCEILGTCEKKMRGKREFIMREKKTHKTKT